MRWFYLAIVVVFVAALIIFVFQNTQSVGISFLALGVTLPLASTCHRGCKGAISSFPKLGVSQWL